MAYSPEIIVFKMTKAMLNKLIIHKKDLVR